MSKIKELANVMNAAASEYARKHNMRGDEAIGAWLVFGCAMLKEIARENNEDVEMLARRVCNIITATIRISKEQ